MENNISSQTPTSLEVKQLLAITPQKSNRLLISLLTLFFLSISVSILYLVYRNLQLKNYDNKYKECIKNGGGWAESYPPQCIYPTSSPDPTTNWKTYTNTSYSFSVKYPSNLLESCNPSPTVDGIRFWKIPWNCPEAHDAPYTIAIIGHDKNIYRKFIANRTKTPISSKVITIAGIDSTQNLYKYSNEDGPLANFQESTEIIIPVGINVVVIQQFGNSLEDKSLFDQILSTFQFTR